MPINHNGVKTIVDLNIHCQKILSRKFYSRPMCFALLMFKAEDGGPKRGNLNTESTLN